MYNIYISYPYNMLTILSKVTDVFKDYNASIKYNKFHDDYHSEYLDTSDIVIFILPDVSFSTPLHRLTNGILSELIKVINSIFKLMKSNLIGSNVSEECVTDKEFINFNDTY